MAWPNRLPGRIPQDLEVGAGPKRTTMHVNGERPESLALEVLGVSKVYGGEVALADASMRVRRGQIHGLLGANGAGKSTLINIIAGVVQQDAGTVAIGGEVLPVGHDAAAARGLGLVHIHQDRALVGDLTVAENIALTLGFPRTRRRFIDRRAMRRNAIEALEQVGLERNVDTDVCDLPIADQTLIAIARALAVDASLILLDEPTANLGARESELLYERLAVLAAGGVTCVLITHALAEARRVCQEVTVLRDGYSVASSRPTRELNGEELAALVVGHAVRTGSKRRGSPTRSDDVVLSMREVGSDRFGPLSLDVHAGEIVGVTGLADSGHLLVGELLNGMRSLDHGSMLLRNKRYAPRGPFDAVNSRVASVPPERIRDGLATEMSARENLFFDGRGVGSAALGIPRRRERTAAAHLLRRGKVSPPEPDAIISTLSGGNMQKVLLAKWLAVEPQLLVLCEPTVGVDVGAREDIYVRLRDAAERGVAILLASSDFEEVTSLCDRVLVIRYGALVASLPDSETTPERLAALSSEGNGDYTL